MKKLFAPFLLLVLVFGKLDAQDFDNALYNPFGLTNSGANPAPALVDIDGDSDFDLIAGYNSGWFGYFQNKGSGNFQLFWSYEMNPWGLSDLSSHSSPAFADLDADGDYDLLSGSDEGLFYFENAGTGTNPNFLEAEQNPFSLIPPKGIVHPFFTDIDDDGDMDLFIGSVNGSTYFFEHTGTPDSVAYALPVKNAFGLKDVGNGAAPAFGDFDMDGDLDAIIGENSKGDLYYFENTGSAQAATFDSIGPNQYGLYALGAEVTTYIEDLDLDGDPDLICGTGDGDFYYFENTFATGIAPSSLPNFEVYPNPVKDVVRLNSPSVIQEVKGFTITGKCVISATPMASQADLDIHNLQPGIYFLKVQLASGLINCKRIVVTGR